RSVRSSLRDSAMRSSPRAEAQPVHQGRRRDGPVGSGRQGGRQTRVRPAGRQGARRGPDLPYFGRKRDMARLHEFLKEHRIKVVILDRLYLALFDGSVEESSGSAYEIGPRLRRATEAYLSAGATPVFVDPPRVARDFHRKPWLLNHLAYPGVGES